MIVKEGLPYLIFSAALAVAGAIWHWWLMVPGFLLFVFCANFFRDPERISPEGDVVVAPADGRIITVRELPIDSEPCFRYFISIFMNVFDVHVNRAPIEGVISQYQYFRGGFKPANLNTASLENERNLVTLVNGSRTVRFSQVAGLLARRIVFWKHETDPVRKGERIGMIRFGSRVDIWLPDGVDILVKSGQKVKAASTTLAMFKEKRQFQ